MEKELVKIALILFLLVVEARTDGCVDGTDSKLLKGFGVFGVVPITCVEDPNDSEGSNSSPDIIDKLVDAFLDGHHGDGDGHGHSKSGIKNEDGDVPNELELWVPHDSTKSDEPNAEGTELPTNLPVNPSTADANNTGGPDINADHPESDHTTDANHPGSHDFKSINPLIALGDPSLTESIPGPAHLNFQQPFTICFDLKYLHANQTIAGMMQNTLDDVPMPLVIAEKDDQVYTNYPRFWKSAS